MGSPLILRIAAKFDPTGVKQAKASVKDLSDTTKESGKAADDSFSSFKKMTDELGRMRGAGKEGLPPVLEGLREFRKAALGLVSPFIAIRRLLFFGSIIAAPIIAATKRAIELDVALRPLVTRLDEIGQAGEFQGRRFTVFADQLQKSFGISAKDTIQSLDILIQKTRTTADAEEIITAAQKIHFGTGAKLVDVTKSIAEALEGHAAGLAAVTGKTEQQINALARSGDLIKSLDADFSAAADRGMHSFSGALEIIAGKFGIISTEALKFAASRLPTTLFTDIAKQVQESNTKVERLQGLLDSIIFNRKTPDLRTFEEMQIAAGKAADEVSRLQAVLSDKSQNLSPKQRSDVEEILKTRQNEQQVLEQQIARERELASSIRERLSAATELLNVQTALLNAQERPRGNDETQEAFDATKKRLREQIELQKESEIRLEAIEEARQIFIKRGELTEEERADIVSRSENKVVAARIEAANKERQINNERLDGIAKLRQAQLDLSTFELEHRVGRFSQADENDVERFQALSAKRQIEIAVLNAQKERDAILSQRQLTADEALRIETELQLKIDKIREDDVEKQAKKEIELSKLTAAQRAKKDKDDQLFKDTVDKFRTGARKTDAQIAFEIDTDKTLKSFRANLDTSGEKDKLQKDLTNLLTPQQKEVKNIVDALEASLKEKKLSLSLSLIQDPAQQKDLAQTLGELISRTVLAALKRRLNPANIVADIISGAAQGGSEQ